MTYLASIKNGTLFDVFKQYPDLSHTLHIFLQDLLRGEDKPFYPENQRLIPVFVYVRKLTQKIETIKQSDIDAILAAGWDEKAAVHANLICGVFNLFNRWVTGLGVSGDKNMLKERSDSCWLRNTLA